MPLPRRAPERRPVPWTELRHQATTVFMWLQAGWTALDEGEREEVRRLVRKSRGRPRNLDRAETRSLGRLAGKAAQAARAAKPARRR
jgi:hypothetical protein